MTFILYKSLNLLVFLPLSQTTFLSTLCVDWIALDEVQISLKSDPSNSYEQVNRVNYKCVDSWIFLYYVQLIHSIDVYIPMTPLFFLIRRLPNIFFVTCYSLVLLNIPVWCSMVFSHNCFFCFSLLSAISSAPNAFSTHIPWIHD